MKKPVIPNNPRKHNPEMKTQPTRGRLLIIFCSLFVIFFFFFGYNRLVKSGPMSIHAWRQSDSYSFALTYYYEHNKLLKPSVLYVADNGSSQTVSEFPILYYLSAKIWEITGVSPGVLKFINFSLLLLGLFHLLLLSLKILKDQFWAFFVVLFLFSSPLLGYYGFNFIPNTPALGLALTGLYYLFRFVETEKTRHLVAFTLLFMLASLIKVTALISFLGAAFVTASYYLQNIRSKKSAIVKFTLASLLIFFTYWRWYSFAQNYNHEHLEGVFNQSIIPIWTLNQEEIVKILKSFYFKVLPVYFNQFALYAVILALIILLLYKGTNTYAKRAAGIYFLGFLGFATLFFQGLDVHDYFLTNTLIFIPAVLTAFLHGLRQNFPGFAGSITLKIIATILLVLLINNSMIITRSHYNPHCPLVKYNIPLKKRERSNWEYRRYRMELVDLQFQGMHKYLRQIGINYNDRVISVDDGTPNLTLSLMHTKGFTEYHYRKNYKGPEKIRRLIELGAKYIVINKHNKLDEVTQAFLGEKVGQYNDISIYSIKQE